MIDKLIEKFRSEDVIRLVKNFISLSVLQGMNYILPLITLPYIARVLGPEKNGLIGFATAFIGYFNIFTDYGFNLSATRDVSINRNDKKKLSEIFSSVMIIKTGLAVVSFIIMCTAVFSLSFFRADAVVYLAAFGIVVGNMLFPVWLFQGIEDMKYITCLNLAGRGIVTVMVFFVVKNEKDFISLILLNGISTIGIGIASLLIVFKKFKVRFILPSFEEIKNQLIEGWYIFISSIGIVLYTSSAAFILGLFANKTIVGYYVQADKIRQAIQGLFTPVFQALYPYVNKVAHESSDKALAFIKKEIIYIGGIGLAICLVVFANAELLVNLILGPRYSNSVPIFKVMAFTPIMVLMGNIFTIQGLLPFGFKKLYSKIYISSSTAGMLLMLILTYLYSSVGMACSVLFIEASVVVLTLYKMKADRISLFARTRI